MYAFSCASISIWISSFFCRLLAALNSHQIYFRFLFWLVFILLHCWLLTTNQSVLNCFQNICTSSFVFYCLCLCFSCCCRLAKRWMHSDLSVTTDTHSKENFGKRNIICLHQQLYQFFWKKKRNLVDIQLKSYRSKFGCATLWKNEFTPVM